MNRVLTHLHPCSFSNRLTDRRPIDHEARHDALGKGTLRLYLRAPITEESYIPFRAHLPVIDATIPPVDRVKNAFSQISACAGLLRKCRSHGAAHVVASNSN